MRPRPRERVWRSFDIEQLSTLYQNLYAYNEMGKTKTRQDTESESTSVTVSVSGSGSASDSDDIRAAVMEAMTDPTVLAMLAERVADAVFAKFEKKNVGFRKRTSGERQADRTTRKKCVSDGGAN